MHQEEKQKSEKLQNYPSRRQAKRLAPSSQSKKISNDQEVIQSDSKSCPQNQKGNN